MEDRYKHQLEKKNMKTGKEKEKQRGNEDCAVALHWK